MPPTTGATAQHFWPCAATGDMFLYAQRNVIVCCRHDTLAVERQVAEHGDDIRLLAVDNVSERHAGRLVFSYDAGQNAIVWDVLTGTEVARFASFSNLTAVAWMQNGAIALGNDAGTIILFDPETLEHVSYGTGNQSAITSLAPAGDLCTFAVGYHTGSVLICSLQPAFTVLHELTTSCGPSPIIGLAWHASSARQRSNMLAVQADNGDLCVWSVAKAQNKAESAKVVRRLNRSDERFPGPNWMSWSKNGRIIQFSKGETLSWDVRTKHVTFDSIPTHEHVRGLAVYGPGACLFTVGANNTVQQFDLNAPAVMVANVQHPANLFPPTPPISVEERDRKAAAVAASKLAAFSGFETSANGSIAETSESEAFTHLDGSLSESDEDYQSPISRFISAGQSTASARSNLSQTVGATSVAASHRSGSSCLSGAGGISHSRNAASVRSQSARTEHTLMSIDSSQRSQQPQAQQQYWQMRDQERPFVLASRTATGTTTGTSTSSATTSHRDPRSHRPRNKTGQASNEASVPDLFKFTRSRLSDVPYQMPPPARSSGRLTNDDLRRQMLYTIFGWTQDIGDLVRDEMNRYPVGSANRILLAKWLGDIHPDIITTSSESMTSSDWMLLALSGIGSHASQYKLGRAYMQRLLESGDIHAAATIMIGMGDCNDAIEIYVSHHKYMEALIVAALFLPSVWERQSSLINKWGEWAIQNGCRELAIRCAACAGMESTEPWTSPSAAQITFPSIQLALPGLDSPPLSPPSPNQRRLPRNLANAPALRLITSFGDATSNIRAQVFHENGGATPLAAGVTPIAASANPLGLAADNDAPTAFLRPSQNSVFNTPITARPDGRDFGYRVVPRIGDDPQVTSAIINHHRAFEAGVNMSGEPSNFTETPQRKLQLPVAESYPIETYRRQKEPPSPPSPVSLALPPDGRKSRNGPPNRLQELQLVPIKPGTVSSRILPHQNSLSAQRYRWPTRRRGPASVSSSVTAFSSATHDTHSTSQEEAGDASDTSEALNEYISSLEEMNAKAGRSSSTQCHPEPNKFARHRRPSATTQSVRSHSPGPSSRVRDRAPSYSRTTVEDRPCSSSPAPRSPKNLSSSLSSTAMRFAMGKPVAELGTTSVTPVPVSVQSSVQNSAGPRPSSRTSSRSRAATNPEDRSLTLDMVRGRNVSRTTYSSRSPSTPLPLFKNTAEQQDSDEADNDAWTALYAPDKPRSQDHSSLHGRSLSHDRPTAWHDTDNAPKAAEKLGDGPWTAMDVPNSATPARLHRNETQTGPPPAPSVERNPLMQHLAGEQLDRRQTQSAKASRGDLRELEGLAERAQRKAAAAQELEDRRMSLVRHALAPSIVHPQSLLSGQMQALAHKSEKGEPSWGVLTKPAAVTVVSTSSNRTRNDSTSGAPSSVLAAAAPKALRLASEIGANIEALEATESRPLPRLGEPPASKPFVPSDSGDSLAFLPQTIYRPPPTRHALVPRSMSAPPQKLRYHKESVSQDIILPVKEARDPLALPTTAIRRPSLEDTIPPEESSVHLPPRLKELAHLAVPVPPPPPPANLLSGCCTEKPPVVYGGHTSGIIEVMMDDGGGEIFHDISV